jgi:RimJ/RimL family protein N-acetyltransferase
MGRTLCSHATGWRRCKLDLSWLWALCQSGRLQRLAAQHGRAGDPQFYTIIDVLTEQPVGLASYLRIDAANGVIEVGHLNYSPLLQQKPAATEAMYLMMRHAFELGYRRYEWKCNALNLPSRRAAERLGFLFEGLFRQSMVIKGRNRDTAWYSILDSEWPAVRQRLEQWLAAENFDAAGRQRQALSVLMSDWRSEMAAAT